MTAVYARSQATLTWTVPRAASTSRPPLAAPAAPVHERSRTISPAASQAIQIRLPSSRRRPHHPAVCLNRYIFSSVFASISGPFQVLNYVSSYADPHLESNAYCAQRCITWAPTIPDIASSWATFYVATQAGCEFQTGVSDTPLKIAHNACLKRVLETYLWHYQKMHAGARLTCIAGRCGADACFCGAEEHAQKYLTDTNKIGGDKYTGDPKYKCDTPCGAIVPTKELSPAGTFSGECVLNLGALQYVPSSSLPLFGSICDVSVPRVGKAGGFCGGGWANTTMRVSCGLQWGSTFLLALTLSSVVYLLAGASFSVFYTVASDSPCASGP